VLRYLQALYGAGTLVGLTDQQLLERFREANRAGDRAGAEAAFDALVERHGPMVWRVCRSLVPHAHDAEDAFQATFLILVRKVNSLRLRATLGAWLQIVAQRMALSARAAVARRRAVEHAAASLRQAAAGPAVPSAASEANELRALIHSEISKLPGTFRAVVVLCDLEGLSYREAADRLNLPIGTIQSRLARARRRLRRALTRQGFSPLPAPTSRDSSRDAILGMPASVGLPHSLARRTCHLAAMVASDPARMRTVVAGSIRTLLEGGLRPMFLSKLGGAMVTMILGLSLCAAMFYPHARSDQPPQGESAHQAASTPEPAGTQVPKRPTIELPAPRKLKVTAGRGGALVYALEKNGDRIPVQRDAPDGPAQEVVRDLQWVVVTGIVDHRRVQEWFRKNGHPTPPRAVHAYRRADLERQVLQKDGTWSPWEPIDIDAKLEILDNLPEVDEELLPERLRVIDLNDPLPFLKKGALRGVHVEELVPYEEREQPAQGVAPEDQGRPPGGIVRPRKPGNRRGAGGRMGMMGMMLGGRAPLRRPQPVPPVLIPESEPPVLMLRQFDFAVESGRTYRYRVRVVLNDGRRRADRPGAWSEATEPVTVPSGTP
jgi:RNA polymerase sigma-70 factor (ECF subfamily)